MKIVKLIPFYGAWPDFMHLYLESCRRNPILNVVFITDLAPFPGSPPNVSYAPLSFDDLKARINRLFGVDVSDIRPYKLCDFRPAYGIIFQDIICDADFWAYGDNDLIYGNVAKFLSSDKLSNYDVLSFKDGHLQGPFTICRNTDAVNNLFRIGGAYQRVFASRQYLSFDEFGPSVFYTKINRHEHIASCASDNISVIAYKKALAGELRVYSQQHGKEDLRNDEVVGYDNGRVFNVRTGEEYLFYHWVLEKRAVWFRYPKWFSQRPAVFYASTTGLYSPSEYRLFRLRHNWRICTGFLKWSALKGSNYVKRRFGRKVTLDTYPRIGWVKSLSNS